MCLVICTKCCLSTGMNLIMQSRGIEWINADVEVLVDGPAAGVEDLVNRLDL